MLVIHEKGGAPLWPPAATGLVESHLLGTLPEDEEQGINGVGPRSKMGPMTRAIKP